MTRASLRSLPAYELGREHERERVSDFHRRMLSGDERDAYLLGRMEERNEQARRLGSRCRRELRDLLRLPRNLR
jgi:hypothetical protein